MDSVEYKKRTTSNVDYQVNDNSLSTVEDWDNTQMDEDIFESPNTSSDLLSTLYRWKQIRSKDDKISKILSKKSKERNILLSKIQAQNKRYQQSTRG